MAAVDELFGNGLVDAQVDQDHEFDGVLNVLVLAKTKNTSSSMLKFLTMRCSVCRLMSVVSTTYSCRQLKHLQQNTFW